MRLPTTNFKQASFSINWTWLESVIYPSGPRLTEGLHRDLQAFIKLKYFAGNWIVPFSHLLDILKQTWYLKSWFIDTTLHISKIFRLNYFSSIFQSKCQFFFCFVWNCKIFRSYFTDYSIADCLSCLNLISASWVKTWVQNKKQLKCENLSIDG